MPLKTCVGSSPNQSFYQNKNKKTLFLCNQRNVQESTIKYIEYSCPNPQLHDKLTIKQDRMKKAIDKIPQKLGGVAV